MKFLKLTTLLLAFFCFSNSSFSQKSSKKMTKKEKKEIKKKLRKYKKNPESYVKMIKSKEKTIKNQEDVIEELTKKLEENNQTIIAQSDSIRALQKRYEKLMAKSNTSSTPMGTVYAVQIGYFKDLNLTTFNAIPKTAKAEIVDGAKRYVIGYFSNPEDALKFRADIQKLGINDAFVSQYINGKRQMNYDAMK